MRGLALTREGQVEAEIEAHAQPGKEVGTPYVAEESDSCFGHSEHGVLRGHPVLPVDGQSHATTHCKEC